MTEPLSPGPQQAEADYLAGAHAAARQRLEGLADRPPAARALLALCRIRQALDDHTDDHPLAREELRGALATPLTQTQLEAERLFALGWLHWLAGEPAAAEPLLAEAREQWRAAQVKPALAEAAYWLGRVRLSLNRADALADYEKVLRSLAGAARATCWYVDLLWRAGRPDRAEQVWKTVRGNARVAACEEAPLLEARAWLQRGELARAERLLGAARPRSGVLQVERLLFLSWALAGQKQYDRAAALLGQAASGPYPAAALQTWRTLLRLRTPASGGGTSGVWGLSGVPEPWRALWQGQRARWEGRRAEAVNALREALAAPAAQAFARYALACLGEEGFAALLAAQPGLFLAVRCRARLACARFVQRQAPPGELLAALEQADAAGYRTAAGDHFRRLALLLSERSPTAAELRTLVTQRTDLGEPARRNHFRVAVEVALRRLLPSEALDLLLQWSQEDVLRGDDLLRPVVGRQLLRLLVQIQGSGADRDRSLAVLERATALLGEHPLLPLLRNWVQANPAAEHLTPDGTESAPLVRVWQAALALAGTAAGAGERGREALRALQADLFSGRKLWPLAQSLLVHEAACRGDAAAVAALLEELDAWRPLVNGPPRFVVRACLAVAPQGHPRLRRSLGRWLSLWDLHTLDPEAQPLAVLTGLLPLRADTAQPPPGTPAVPWLLHQAALALGRQDPGAALTWLRRARALEPDLAGAGASAGLARAAAPELERLARAQALAGVIRLHPEQTAVAPHLLGDMVHRLEATPEGQALFAAEAQGDRMAAWQALAVLAGRDDLPAPLAHHLALVYHRAALFFESRELTTAADPCWRLAWHCWLLFLREDVPGRQGLLDWLLGLHRRRLTELLARNQVDQARRHWDLVQSLPRQVRSADTLAREVSERVARFREELATAYLVITREAMRYGAIPDGWEADYEKGLSYLCRFLSLDRENVRLLTALVEICGDWFLDCYRNEARAALGEALERFTPFALQLARLVADRPGELAARAALAQFYKFRGLVAGDRQRKLALYREALHFNPANENVQELLAALEEKAPEAP